MYTHAWQNAVILQSLIAIGAVLIAVSVLRVRFGRALLAALLFNTLPVMKAPGFQSPVFVHDLLLPILVIVLLLRFSRVSHGLLALALMTVFLWPIIGVLVTVTQGATGHGYLTYLYRRLDLVLFLAVGTTVVAPKMTNDVLDTFMIVWIGMAAVGLAQYFGVVDVDFVIKDPGSAAGDSILTDSAAQRGFMGLNRGAVGVWCSAVSAYCVAHLLLDRRPGSARVIIYTVATALTATVVLFSGSRTGAVACLAGVGYVAVVSLRHMRDLRTGRLMVFGTMAAAGAIYLIGPALSVVGKRLDVQSAQGSLSSRLATQAKVIKYAFTHPEAALFGNGHDTFQFRTALNTRLTHPHSEYIETLWSAGLPGLALYLVLLITLYRGIRPSGVGPDVLSIGSRGMFFAGCVAGLAVGNLTVTSPRLATYGITMVFVYGMLFAARRRSASEPVPMPAVPTMQVTPLGA